jgi:hypothetical protein
MIDLTREPGRGELRWFGLLLAAVAAFLGSVLRWQFELPGAARWIWIAGAAVAALYYAAPPLRMPIYLSWIYLTYPLGWVFSHLVLGIIWFGVVTPIGLVMRAVGYDPLRLARPREGASQWIEHRPHRDLEGYFRRF